MTEEEEKEVVDYMVTVLVQFQFRVPAGMSDEDEYDFIEKKTGEVLDKLTPFGDINIESQGYM